MKDIDIAWLAGIVDGEGCFSVKMPVKRGRGLRRVCKQRASSCTSLDMAVLETLSAVKLNGGETPAEVQDLLREVIPSEALRGAVSAKTERKERVETQASEPNNNLAHERPAPSQLKVMM